MRKVTIIFWLVFWLFVYKLTYLEREEPRNSHKFSLARDQHGIPHIYAKSYEQILFGLGYAEAQDRMFALYFKKLFVQGRTAQLFGPELIATDLEMRNIGFHEMGKTNKLHTDNETLKLLQAYADGINAYAREVKLLPFQFYLFWTNWQDWTVQNSLALVNLMSFFLQFDWFYEIARQRLLQTVGFQLATKVMTFGGKNLFRNTTIISDQELKDLGKYKQYNFDEQTAILKQHWANKNITLGSVHFPEFDAAIEGSGSNGWVIGKEHTTVGRPILANDPHVGSLIPNMFYLFQAVLLSENNQTKSRKFGIMADGLPSVSVGISELAAWGSTAAYIDNKDVYYQTVRNNSGKMQYLFKDQWHDFRQRKQVLKARGGEDVEQIFYHTHRGVVIESIFMELHWKYGYPMPKQYKDNHTLSLVANHFRPDNSSAKGLLRLLTFQTYDEFNSVSELMNHPNIDGLCIFPNGSFTYFSVGGIPKRNIPEMGSFIKDGNLDIYDMGQNLSFEQKLSVVDMKKGYLSMGNNRFASQNFEFRSAIHQLTTGRSYIIDKLISQKISRKQKFSFEDIAKMQLNQKDQFLSEVLGKFLGRLTHFRQIWSDPQTQKILQKLDGWDATMDRDSAQAAIYHVWEHLFSYSLFSLTALNQYQKNAIVSHAFFQNFYFLLLQKFGNNKLTEEEKIVCQSLQTAKYKQIHPCQAAIALAFKKLPAQLNKLFGTDNVEEYKWGAIHQQTFTIVPFSKIPGLKNIWNRNYPAGGNSRTINVAIHAHQANSYNSIGSPAFRFITDLNRTLYSLQAGTTDRISSPNFDKFINANQYLEYVPHNPFIQGLPSTWQFYVNKLE